MQHKMKEHILLHSKGSGFKTSNASHKQRWKQPRFLYKISPPPPNRGVQHSVCTFRSGVSVLLMGKRLGAAVTDTDRVPIASCLHVVVFGISDSQNNFRHLVTR